MMNPAQQTTLKAFVLAVAQLEPPLAPDVKAVLTTISQELHTQPNHALDTINQIVENHEQLSGLYQTARQELHKQHTSKERDKFKLPTAITQLPMQSLRPSPSSQATIKKQPLCRLSNAFADITQVATEQISDKQDAFFDILHMKCAVAVGKARLLDFSVLSAIEHRPLTTEDLAYHLERPFNHVSQVINQLWEDRKIDTMGSATLQKMLPFLRSRQQPNPEAYWTLTSLGHFSLHPIIPLRQMGVQR